MTIHPLVAQLPRVRRWGPRLLGGALVLVAALIVFVRLTPPSFWIDRARFVRPPDAFSVVDRRGNVLRHARASGVDRRWVALEDVSPHLVDAVLATEDARFREHGGVDGRAFLRAVISNLRPWGKRSGGSTITQQVVKLVYGRPMGPLSKALELARATALERTFSKDEILEQYLNRVPFGDRIEGVARASEEYFGHPVGELSIAEAALLAGIPQAPSATEPRRHLERALRRRRHVLARMVSVGRLSEAARKDLETAAPAIREVPRRPNEAPRFVDAALARYRKGELERKGGTLTTTLDRELSRRATEVLGDTVQRFASRGVTNGAAVVVANATGEVIAYVGAARTGPLVEGGAVDLLTRGRQPGSTLKPFVYGLFFERGGTAATVLDDIARPRLGARGTPFDAKDYDGLERGPVRAREALASSLNLAALDAAARVGQDAFVAHLASLGFRGLKAADHYGAAAVLGGVDVTPLDLAAAYVALARRGESVGLSFAPGTASRGRRVMKAAAAEVVRDILSDARVRRDAFGADLVELAGGPFALKTGTSSGWRDAWSAAFTDEATVVVWLGDPSGRPLGGVSGFEAAAPAAARILAAARSATADQPKVGDAAPDLVTVPVCAATGLRPGPQCRHTVDERFAAGTVPSEPCSAHDEHGDVELPPRYADWVKRTHPPGIARTFASPTAETEGPVVRHPRDGARWLVDASRGTPTVSFRATVGGKDATDVAWEVDGVKLAGPDWELARGEHAIVALWRGKKSDPVRVRVEAVQRER